VATTGGLAKQRIEEGTVEVNGAAERRRGRRLRDGDLVGVGGDTFVVRYPASGP